MKKFDIEKWKEETKKKMIEEGKNNPHAIAGFVGGECVFGKENLIEEKDNEL